MYKVYGVLASRAFRVTWMLEEIGQPYEVVQAGPHSDAILAVNPSGKIPALVDGTTTLVDSTAIMTYLADRHGLLTEPAGTPERARQDALTHMLLDEFDAVLWTAARYDRILPEEYRAPQVVPGLRWEFERSLDRLGDSFEGPFLTGAQMSIADILAIHCLGWAKVAGFPVENAVMRGYVKSMTGRDAYIRARAAMS